MIPLASLVIVNGKFRVALEDRRRRNRLTDTEFTDLWLSGVGAKVIAARAGGMSRTWVKTTRKRLGLPARWKKVVDAEGQAE